MQIKNKVHTLLKTGTAPILLFLCVRITTGQSTATGNDTREELAELAERNAHRHWTVSGYCAKGTSLFQPWQPFQLASQQQPSHPTPLSQQHESLPFSLHPSCEFWRDLPRAAPPCTRERLHIARL